MSYAQERERFHELDALRGLAAVVVVLTHYHDLLFPKSERLLMSHVKLGLLYLAAPFYSGQSAVVLFFVLSGFVLALPFLTGKEQAYPVFALRRIARIYLPYLAALAIAVCGNIVFQGRLVQGVWPAPPWSNLPTVGLVLQHILFIGSYNPLKINTVFWTLVIEMRVSLVFPFLARAALRVGLLAETLFLFVAIGVMAELCIRDQSSDLYTTLRFGCCFLVGIQLARTRLQIAAWYAGLSPIARLALAGVTFCCFGYAIATRTPRPIIECFCLAGAIGCIVLSLQPGRWREFLRGRVPQYLGQISYSMYLVHIPVLFTCFALIGRSVSRPVILMVYLPSVLLVSTGFHYAIEGPCLRLSRRVGRLSLPTEREAEVLETR